MNKNKIKNLEKVARRLHQAINDKENIYVCSDSDVDGVGAAIIFKETVQYFNGEIKDYFLPDREQGGYGLNPVALDFFLQKEPGLLFLLDLGIANFEAIKKAEEAGFEVIVIDHHQILEKKPAASFIIDPHQEEDHYPFSDFAAAGLVYYLAEEMFCQKEIDFKIQKPLLELATVSTVADMMPLEEDNREIIDKGTEEFKTTERIGFQLLKKAVGKDLNVHQQISRMVGLLNMSRLTADHLTEAFKLLTTTDANIAQEYVDLLVKERKSYNNKQKEMLAKFDNINKDQNLIFAGDKSWRPVLMGSVASKLSRRYECPVFLYARGEKISRGSVRAPEGINVVKLMQKCSSLLINFGGHPPAAGFEILTKNLEKFKKCLQKNLKKK